MNGIVHLARTGLLRQAVNTRLTVPEPAGHGFIGLFDLRP